MKKLYTFVFLICFSFISVYSQVQVGTGTVTNEELPIEPYYGYTYSQVIYTSAEINSSGDISGISYTATAETTLASCSDWTVYMAHTANSSFADGDSWEPFENLTQMFTGTVSIADGIVDIIFDTPFSYDGSNNLLIAVDQNQAGYDSSAHDFYCSTTSDVRALTYYSDSTNPDPTAPLTGQIRNSIANVTLNGITQSCTNPTLSLDDLTNNSATISWSATDVSSFEYVLQASGTGEPSTAGTITSESSVTFNNLTEGSAYEIYVRSVCGDIYSGWVLLTFTPPPTGSTGDNPIIIESLPYNTSDDTINYGDDYTNTATDCESGAGYYLSGDDVVYSYTTSTDASINVKLSPQDTYAGVYVYANADDIGVNCWIAELQFGFSSETAAFDLTVTEGSTYYFVISTWATPQNVAYELTIVENTCTQPSITTSIETNCSGGAGDFSILVDVDDLGSLAVLSIDDGVETQTIETTGVLTFGPYDSGSTVNINVVTDDVSCNSSYVLTYVCPPTGSLADDPIIIESIPYETTDDTINYGDDYTNTATNCDSGLGYYLGGDDVVYLYTAASNMTLNVSLSPEDNYAGVYVYANANDIGVNCWIAELQLGFSMETAAFELAVTEGSTYYFVISSWASPQNIAYGLSITELLCGTPTNLAVSNVTSVSADVSWDAGEAVSWEYVSSTVADSSVPTEAGTSIAEPSVSIADCYPITGYNVWVRALCEDGSTSDWTSITFTTTLQSPECGESISQYDYPNASSGGSVFDDNFDVSNDYSSDLLFTSTSGDQDGDGYTDEITVAISGSTESNFDWVFITNGAGELLYGPESGAQDIAITSADGTINVYLAADGSVQGGPINFDISCAGLSVNDFDMSNLRIYPNPVNGDYVTIQSPLSGLKNIEVFDITGKRLINTSLNSDTLDISTISTGIYLVKVTVQGQSKVSKLIVR